MKLIYRNMFASIDYVDCASCKNFLVNPDNSSQCTCTIKNSDNIFDPYSFTWTSVDKIMAAHNTCTEYKSILNWKKL